MLYRGEDWQTHIDNGGRITPKGNLIEVVARLDGSFLCDGKFNFGPSENNAARAQHIDSGKWGTSFVSTTRSHEQARKFATSSNLKEGVIYWIDEGLCAQHGVVLKEFSDLLHPQEAEVSIRAADGGQIPPEVIVRIEHVSPT